MGFNPADLQFSTQDILSESKSISTKYYVAFQSKQIKALCGLQPSSPLWQPLSALSLRLKSTCKLSQPFPKKTQPHNHFYLHRRDMPPLSIPLLTTLQKPATTTPSAKTMPAPALPISTVTSSAAPPALAPCSS